MIKPIVKDIFFLGQKSEEEKFGEEMREKLENTGCVSEDEQAHWLIDYWCGKDIAGLIKMPFSRHWIMHIEAMRRIKNKLCKMARKSVDQEILGQDREEGLRIPENS